MRQSQPSVSRPSIVVLGLLLSLTAMLVLITSLAIILDPRESMYGEAILYDQAARLRHGEALYQPFDRPPYTVAAYMPLYYALAAELQAAIGHGFASGRSLSFLAGLAVVGMVGYLAARGAGDRRAGVLAAVLFFALGLAHVPWSALYKEDVLGVALSLGAIAVLIRGATAKRLIVAGVLAGLALLTKQTLVAATIAGAIWLLPRERHKAILFVGTCLVLVIGTGVALEITTGAFAANVVSANLNPLSMDVLARNTIVLALFQAGPIALAGPYVLGRVRSWQRPEHKLLVFYWLASLLTLSGLAKVGSNYNYWIELAAITAVLAVLAVWDHPLRFALSRRSPAMKIGVLLVGLNLALNGGYMGASLIDRLQDRLGRGAGETQEFGMIVERVRAEPAEVLADPLDVLALADRRVLFEPYIFSIMYSEGQWVADPLIRRICAGDVGLLVLDHPLESELPVYDGYTRWPSPVLAALRAMMALEQEKAGRFLYAPVKPIPSDRCQESTGLPPAR